MSEDNSRILGINGLGRIGKLTVWHHVGRGYFDELVVNLGREAGRSLGDIAHYIERDTTYGRLNAFLHGHGAPPVITDIDEAKGTMQINNVKVTLLREKRNPREIGWGDHGARLVVDTTGQFLDPNLSFEASAGSVRGHLECGAQKVVVSAPFKVQEGSPMPDDAVTTVMGINDKSYDPRIHSLISNASCTTNCLAHMIKPLLDYFGADRILSASMATVHAATGSQQVLDRLPKKGATDLRKSRSVMNNIILTSTGAARALALVIPEMETIGFIAESVRIPTASGSLIILVLNIQDAPKGGPINKALINELYRKTATEKNDGYLVFTEKQNVSADIVGTPRAATIIEGHETHTRTAEISIDLGQVKGLDPALLKSLDKTIARIPVTNAVIYGWYDNEMASYVNTLGDRTVSIAETI
ncbi:Gap2 [Desulforapulum autotrophicum HRM2]|uniref:Gap2 n=1 Tax=Desulforapulum autotrophicum (strain ATCC 43914 / DSM 3382 / VKM B-1955 / HRM2) TaxID=177437 RepID=C0QM46_DESAH|nr:glyceraldehyde 3-phosphate dehydrogenase NAD-binding domain-containing protein [Desulforapulum autotrophicum]ACN14352.1 Gap2 [Desulforapulum autotrophicum HRM2]